MRVQVQMRARARVHGVGGVPRVREGAGFLFFQVASDERNENMFPLRPKKRQLPPRLLGGDCYLGSRQCEGAAGQRRALAAARSQRTGLPGSWVSASPQAVARDCVCRHLSSHAGLRVTGPLLPRSRDLAEGTNFKESLSPTVNGQNYDKLPAGSVGRRREQSPGGKSPRGPAFTPSGPRQWGWSPRGPRRGSETH